MTVFKSVFPITIIELRLSGHIRKSYYIIWVYPIKKGTQCGFLLRSGYYYALVIGYLHTKL